MSVQELKSHIHQSVDAAENEAVLEEVNNILVSNAEGYTLDDLTGEQLVGIEQAREEVRQGKGMSLAEMREKHRKRFPTANI